MFSISPIKSILHVKSSQTLKDKKFKFSGTHSVGKIWVFWMSASHLSYKQWIIIGKSFYGQILLSRLQEISISEFLTPGLNMNKNSQLKWWSLETKWTSQKILDPSTLPEIHLLEVNSSRANSRLPFKRRCWILIGNYQQSDKILR